jgi:hypothetical protein
LSKAVDTSFGNGWRKTCGYVKPSVLIRLSLVMNVMKWLQRDLPTEKTGFLD